MKRYIHTLLLVTLCCLPSQAQQRKVENRPYTDLRPLHFGILVGSHVQDIELVNVGPVSLIQEDGTVSETVITADQDRYDIGLTVGVLAEARLSRHFQLRVVPALYFGNRHLAFRNYSSPADGAVPTVRYQDLKSIYVSSAIELLFAAPRFNNHRPYLLAGVNPMLNLSGKDDDIIKLKKGDVYAEVGVGCDLYFPFFKLRPELKFLFSLSNALDTKHADKLKDKQLLPYAKSVCEAHTKMIVLSFYFE